MDDQLRALVARATAYGHLEPDKGRCGMATAMKAPKRFNPEEAFVSTRIGGGSHKYEWDVWFNGQIHTLARSEGPENDKGTIEEPTILRDFGVPTDAMKPKTHTAARRRYKIAYLSRTQYDEASGRFTGPKCEHDGLVVFARDMNDEERAEEDRKRAIEKQIVKAVKAVKDAKTPEDLEAAEELLASLREQLKNGTDDEPEDQTTDESAGESTQQG